MHFPRKWDSHTFPPCRWPFLSQLSLSLLLFSISSFLSSSSQTCLWLQDLIGIMHYSISDRGRGAGSNPTKKGKSFEAWKTKLAISIGVFGRALTWRNVAPDSGVSINPCNSEWLLQSKSWDRTDFTRNAENDLGEKAISRQIFSCRVFTPRRSLSSYKKVTQGREQTREIRSMGAFLLV